MARILALDYGTKRTGVAVTDPLKIIATSLTTVETKEIFEFLTKYFGAEKVELVVIGLPKQMNNTASESLPFIEEFVAAFKKKYPDMPIEYYDERFTSKMAVAAMVQGGLKKKDRQNKAMIDTVSATILLQSYLERQNF